MDKCHSRYTQHIIYIDSFLAKQVKMIDDSSSTTQIFVQSIVL